VEHKRLIWENLHWLGAVTINGDWSFQALKGKEINNDPYDVCTIIQNYLEEYLLKYIVIYRFFLLFTE